MALPLSQEKREAIVFHKINGEKKMILRIGY